jgi:hypothetical protein
MVIILSSIILLAISAKPKRRNLSAKQLLEIKHAIERATADR